MSNPEQAQALSNLQNTIVNVAKNKVLAAMVVPVDTFLNTLQTNTNGNIGIVAALDVLKAQTLQALPTAETNTVQAEAGVLEGALNAEVQKTEAANTAAETNTGNGAAGQDSQSGATGGANESAGSNTAGADTNTAG